MFGVELFSGWHSGSLSLLADSIDFAGDALNHGVSLAAAVCRLTWRDRAAVVKALCMMGFWRLDMGPRNLEPEHRHRARCHHHGVVGLLAPMAT